MTRITGVKHSVEIAIARRAQEARPTLARPADSKTWFAAMKRWSRAGRKAPINRTHSKRFALTAESANDAAAFGVRASSAPPSQGRLRFDGRVGSWRASFRFCTCNGTMNLTASATETELGLQSALTAAAE